MKFKLNKIKMCILKHYSSKPNIITYNLVSRKWIRPTEFTHEEVKSVLWTAIELKTLKESNKMSAMTHLIENSRLTLLTRDCRMDIKIPTIDAASNLKIDLKIVHDPTWDKYMFVTDIGKFLSLYSDMLLCQGKYQSKIEKMAAGLNIPMVNLETCSSMIYKVLTHLMTLQERYSHLDGLNIARIGPPTTLLNTYLCIAPHFGINISYSCSMCKSEVSPAKLLEGQMLCKQTHTHIQEYKDCQQAVANAHVILTSSHNEPDMKVTLKMLEKANPDWSLLCSFPRGPHEVDLNVVQHENSLVWKAAYNSHWILTALILRLLHNYQHATNYPFSS